MCAILHRLSPAISRRSASRLELSRNLRLRPHPSATSSMPSVSSIELQFHLGAGLVSQPRMRVWHISNQTSQLLSLWELLFIWYWLSGWLLLGWRNMLGKYRSVLEHMGADQYLLPSHDLRPTFYGLRIAESGSNDGVWRRGRGSRANHATTSYIISGRDYHYQSWSLWRLLLDGDCKRPKPSDHGARRMRDNTDCCWGGCGCRRFDTMGGLPGDIPYDCRRLFSEVNVVHIEAPQISNQ